MEKIRRRQIKKYKKIYRKKIKKSKINNVRFNPDDETVFRDKEKAS